MPFRIRPLVRDDLPDLLRIDRESYRPEFRESDAAFLAKIALFPAGCLGCFQERAMCGYVFALPWTATRLIGVGELVQSLPDRPDVMYLHDMVVDPDWRGRRVAALLLAEITRLAASLDLHRIVLVAVQDSEPFWQHAGFRIVERFDYVPGTPASRMALDL